MNGIFHNPVKESLELLLALGEHFLVDWGEIVTNVHSQLQVVVIRRIETLVDIAKDDEVSAPRPEILHHVLQGVFGQLLEACSRTSLVATKSNFL